MEQHPSREQIEFVVQLGRHVLDIATRNNAAFAGRKLSPLMGMAVVAPMEISSATANLIEALRSWGGDQQGDSFESCFLSDVCGAHGELLFRAQEILDLHGFRPAKLYGDGHGPIKTADDGTWLRVPDECLADMTLWIERLEKVAARLPVEITEDDAGADAEALRIVAKRLHEEGWDAKANAITKKCGVSKQRALAALRVLRPKDEE